jgi:hypothetical protein
MKWGPIGQGFKMMRRRVAVPESNQGMPGGADADRIGELGLNWLPAARRSRRCSAPPPVDIESARKVAYRPFKSKKKPTTKNEEHPWRA